MTSLYPETDEFLQALRLRPDVVGVLLVGSKSRGYQDARSDDDLEVILHEPFDAPAPQFTQYYHPCTHQLLYDVRYTTLSAMRQKVPSPVDTEHWPYERARVLYDADNSGLLEDTRAAIANMDATFRTMRINYAAVSTTVAIGKAHKALQRGYTHSAKLVVARGVTALARLLFALEGRWKPTDHWLEWELETLHDDARVTPLLLEAVHERDPQSLRAAMDALEATFPQEVPNKKMRAHLYEMITSCSQATQREQHMLF